MFRRRVQGPQKHERELTARGKTQSLRAWARELGIAHTTISRRLAAGCTVHQALFAPKGTWKGAA